jgi:hypothetical protein
MDKQSDQWKTIVEIEDECKQFRDDFDKGKNPDPMTLLFNITRYIGRLGVFVVRDM